MTATPRVGVVGASARAAVHSLARAGLAAWAVDLFGDRDLAGVARCAVCPFDAYPDAIPEMAARFPSGPVLYTGGLENHPRLIAELAVSRELWGNPTEVVRRVRDPQALSAALWGKGFAYPRLAGPGASCPREGRWLRKPLRSSAGRDIRFALPDERPSSNHYFQEFIDGPPMSVALAIVQERATILGFTQQLVGAEWLHARPFQYAGNIGPVKPPRPMESKLSLLGQCLRMELNLRGIVGVDFIPRGDENAWVLEVNPRYPASVEALEHATGRAAFLDLAPQPPSAAGRGEIASRRQGDLLRDASSCVSGHGAVGRRPFGGVRSVAVAGLRGHPAAGRHHRTRLAGVDPPRERFFTRPGS
jgi:hypothetical protein